MSRNLPNFNADSDRNDPRRAAQLFDLLCPNRKIRIAVADRFARSIRVAHNVSEASWSVSMFDWGVRLNVGQVALLNLASDEILAILKTAKRTRAFDAVPMRSVAVRFLPEKIATISRAQWDAHNEFIEAAAFAKPRTPFKSSFSESVVRQIEKIVGTELPRPAHQARPLHILQGGVDNGDKSWLEKASRLGLRRSTWIAPKSASAGDQAVIFVPGEGFFATARITGAARARSDWPNRYGAPIDDVKLLTSPISIDTIRAKLPKLSGAIYPRSIHTVSPEVAHMIRGLLAGNVALSGAEDIAIEQDKSLTQSQREALILARRGQGQYRKQLVEMWNGCSITGSGPVEILRASHIKPWHACSSYEERLDKYNGLLLLPNLDALFDRALITFDEDGRIVVSRRVPKRHWDRLGISLKMKVRLLPQHAIYFVHHRMRFDELKSQA
jgi:hypothetical protein